MNEVRLGIVGLGSMGQAHFHYMDGVSGARVTAVCDRNPRCMEPAVAKIPSLKSFTKWQELLDSGLVDAVLIATPHYIHPDISIAALSRDIHVLAEKPVAVTVGAARRANHVAAAKPHLKYAAMFMQRIWPAPKKLHELVQSGELGAISRITWIATDWFRPNSYYASGSWRATWSGEGGGVLINQCPHNLDLMWWITGMMPKRVTALAFIGKTHPIETEDEVSAILEYDNGATGHFITTTGEAPGTNMLEIAGDRGIVRMEAGALHFRRTKQSVSEFRRTSLGPFSLPQVEPIDVQLDAMPVNSHQFVTQNFIDAIIHDRPLIAPAEQGVHSLELANAMLWSGLTRKSVDLPLDADSFEAFLAELVAKHPARP